MLTTNQKGAIAEAAITKAAMELGYGVYRPAIEGGRYDLIFDTGDELQRVQCKWAPLNGEVVVIRAYSTRRTATGLRRNAYKPGEFDVLAAYCAARPGLCRAVRADRRRVASAVACLARPKQPARRHPSC